MVVALIALFVAMSGSAVALKGRNTVDSGDIINGQVKAPDVGTGEIASEEVLDGSVGSLDVSGLTGNDVGGLTGANVSDGTLTGDDLQNDSVKGVDVDEGTFGTVPSVDSKSIVSVDYFSVDNGAPETVLAILGFQLVATCDGGNFELAADAVTSGGFIQSSSGAGDSQFQLAEAPIEVQTAGNDADTLVWQGTSNKFLTFMFAYREPGTQCSMKGMAIVED